MSGSHEFGSAAWLEEVFGGGPARVIKGRTKWTHRHATATSEDTAEYLETRGEYISFQVLRYLKRLGKVKRFKAQPFTTDPELFGCIYTPDYLVEDFEAKLFAIDSKTARFIRRADELQFEHVKKSFSTWKIGFQIWTNESPLNLSVQNNFLRLKRATTENIKAEEISHFVTLLRDKGAASVRQWYDRGFDATLISRAVAEGLAFFPLFEPFSGETYISPNPVEEVYRLFFDHVPEIEGWWKELEATNMAENR